MKTTTKHFAKEDYLKFHTGSLQIVKYVSRGGAWFWASETKTDEIPVVNMC